MVPPKTGDNEEEEPPDQPRGVLAPERVGENGPQIREGAARGGRGERGLWRSRTGAPAGGGLIRSLGFGHLR